jgi:hypothetical protein
VMITGKILFSELCLREVTWDEQIPDDIVHVPRSKYLEAW